MRNGVCLLFMLIVVCMEAAGGEKNCPVCGGTGHPFGQSDVLCQRCYGSGRVPLSPAEEQREARERERYAEGANDLMEAYGLTPEEYFAYEELTRQAMQQMPVYDKCTSCEGTGNCKMCGGYMNLSLDGDLCMLCGGSGVCPVCRGAGQFLVGYQDNPNKDQLLQSANDILNHGRQQGGDNNDYDGQSELNSDNDFNSGNSSSGYRKTKGIPPYVYILIGFGIAGVIFLFVRRKK